MNQTEKSFSELLERARQEGVIVKWHFEEITLKIAPNTRYIPDFVAVMPEGRWEIFEIKGHLEDDAAVKFKAAAEKFPELGFHMLKKKRGNWETIYHLPSRSTPPPIFKQSLKTQPSQHGDTKGPQSTHTPNSLENTPAIKPQSTKKVQKKNSTNKAKA